MTITSDDIEWFKEAYNTVKRGYYPSGQKAIESYKRIFKDEIAEGKMRSNLNPKCGSCIRTAVTATYNKIIELERIIDEQPTEKENQGT